MNQGFLYMVLAAAAFGAPGVFSKPADTRQCRPAPPVEPAHLSATQYLVIFYLCASWYDAFHAKWERRFANGLSYTASYAFSKNLCQACELDRSTPVPFAPEDYNRGRSSNDRPHILVVNGIYEVPVESGKRFLSSGRPVVNGVLGGWQLSGIYSFTSGSPLTITVPGATLGDGYNTQQAPRPRLDEAFPDNRKVPLPIPG